MSVDVEAAVPAYILAGGRSSRFGSDKARALVGGTPLILRAAHELEPHASRITVVASQPDAYADLGLRTIGDRAAGRGPLGGLEAALADDAGAGWILLGACDLLGLGAGWISQLLAARELAAEAPAIAFRGALRWEPLPALYHARIAARARRELAAGELALHRLLADAGARGLPCPEGWEDLVRVTTPADLARAAAL
jgi:molybdopterin-guanine dinucleotide biosynthesis protein A